MRALADAERLRRFLRELAQEAEADATVYLTGGATAVLLGWRGTTIDADMDLADVTQLLDRGLVEPRRLRELFDAIDPLLYRYPAVDPPSFRKRLDDVLRARS